MAKGKDPAFLFYPSDFLAGTAHFTDEEVGAYIKLLCHQFNMGRLPQEKIKRLCPKKKVWDMLSEKLIIGFNSQMKKNFSL